MQIDYERDVLHLENKLKKLTNEKYELEENIISQLQNEVVSNNATVKLNEDICKLRQTSLQLVGTLHYNYSSTQSLTEGGLCTHLFSYREKLNASRMVLIFTVSSLVPF